MQRDIFRAIADPIRREIIELLADDRLTVNEIAENFKISRPAVSKHLKILQECGVINVKKQGRERICFIDPKELLPVAKWVEQYRKLWEDKLDSFESYLSTITGDR